MLTNALLFDPEAQDKQRPVPEPDFLSDEWWQMDDDAALNPASRNIIFRDIAGLSGDAIYICGEVGPGTKPVLCYCDGQTLEELKVPVQEAALTGIFIESPESVWLCGREGVLLHGSRARGFNPVNAQTRLNLFHDFAAWRDRLLLAASVRPGGLWQLDPATNAFSRFEPRLPALTKLDSNPAFALGGPFYVEAFGDVIWAVASKGIFRFDGERIKHPDLS